MNIFKEISKKIEEARKMREWRNENFAKKHCSVYRLSNNYKIVSCIYDKDTGWSLYADPVQTVSINEAPMVLGEAVVAILMQTKVKEVDLKSYMSKEAQKEWLYRNFKLKSFDALYKNSICDISLYKNDFMVSSLKLNDDGKGWVYDKEKQRVYNFPSITPEDIGIIIFSLTTGV